ncbi:hypothetical protein STCU_08464 [Strigomonas culicis]|nr:hypothetical protein STCU_08464 [Strigomonas culicis]|eukprot:EPY21842.1 hypothetical protein STCU_08464 [Strigomonas culicis]
MGMMGTFEDAFGNMIVEDPVTKKITMEEENSFKLLLSEIVGKFPQIDIIYDFLGFNAESGYRESFKKFAVDLLAKKNKIVEHTPDGRVSFYNPASKEIFFDFNNSKAQIVSDDSVYGLPDFLYVQDTDMFLLTIASENHWLRSRQVPHAKQLEGIARRASFILGIPYDSVRIRNVLLPPSYMDKSSLERVVEAVFGIGGSEKQEFIPWLKLYSKELDAQDVDYCDIQKTVNEEEWLTL